MIVRQILLLIAFSCIPKFAAGRIKELCIEQTGVCINLEAATAEQPKGANSMGKPREVSKACVDRHQECKHFASRGECIKTPGWMIVNCPKSCNPINGACALRNKDIRCARERLDMVQTPIYQPGDMNAMFSSVISRFSEKYDIKVWSEDPWVVTFEDFISDAEAEALITTQDGWERSTDTGSTNEHGETGRVLSSGRTSANSWCRGRCENHPDVKRVMQKIEEVTFVPSVNYESFQVLRYEIGQKYREHHDYGPGDKELTCGPRILTFFLYLSDVEEGGETSFPGLGISVKPKKGRALLWPSTLDAEPDEIDQRTRHEAKPIISGTKYAANAWIHLYNYAEPNKWGCTGTFDEL